MKKVQTVFLLLFQACCLMHAQNIQFHYDLGHNVYARELATRPSVTTTIELFKPDRWGSTFLFCDLDYYTRGLSGAYWEVSREINIGRTSHWAAHVEYNGGASTAEDMSFCNRFQHALLVGPAWNWHSADFSRTFSLQTMYKQYFRGQQGQKAFCSFQLTEVWGLNFAKELLTCSGFADLWYDGEVDGNLVFLAEPQLWFNVYALKGMQDVRLSLGTEVELSNNFVFDDKGRNNRCRVIPTLAAKWTF